MGVDHAWCDDAAAGVVDVGVGMFGEQRGRRPDRNQALLVEYDRTSDEHLSSSVHGDDVTVHEDLLHGNLLGSRAPTVCEWQTASTP